MRWNWTLLLLLALGTPARAGEPLPAGPSAFQGVGPLDPYRAADQDPRRLAALAEAGPLRVLTTPIAWGRVESEPPRAGQHNYQWRPLDEAFVLWQLAGLDPVPVLSPANPWAGVPLDQSAWTRRLQSRFPPERTEAFLRAGVGCTPPRPDRWQEWQQFVEAFLERYDGDGVDDAPTLRRPIRAIQILDRFDLPSVFAGDVMEYQRLLHHAGLAVERAAPTCRIVAGAFDLLALGHAPLPPPDVLALRRAKALPEAPELSRLEMEEAYARIEAVLAMPQLFQVLMHVGSGYASDDVSNLNYLAAWKEAQGAEQIELWLGGPPATRLERPRTPAAPEPNAQEARLRNRRGAAARSKDDPAHAAALRFQEEGAALQRLRSVLAACGAGARVVFQGRCWDAADPLLVQGPTPGSTTATASLYLMADLNRRLLGLEPQLLPTRSGMTSVLFRQGRDATDAWVQVHVLDESVVYAPWPGESDRAQESAIAVPPGGYAVQPVALGPTATLARSLDAPDGVLLISLDGTPLFVSPAR